MGRAQLVAHSLDLSGSIAVDTRDLRPGIYFARLAEPGKKTRSTTFLVTPTL